MREIFTEALVLEKNPVNEYDARVILFTKAAGKISAKATSVRKITSKLSAHLEPLWFAQVRLVEARNGDDRRFHVADALRTRRLPSQNIQLLRLIGALATPGETDPRLWEALRHDPATGEVLAILGFDPRHAFCERCKGPPERFLLTDSAYYCAACIPPSVDREAYVILHSTLSSPTAIGDPRHSAGFPPSRE